MPESGLGIRERQLEIVPLMMYVLAARDRPEPQKCDRSHLALHTVMTVRAQPSEVHRGTAYSTRGFELFEYASNMRCRIASALQARTFERDTAVPHGPFHHGAAVTQPAPT